MIQLEGDWYIKTEALGAGFEATVTNGGIIVGVLPLEEVRLEMGFDYRDINAGHQ